MKQVGIICGGYSSEYDISVKSATTIRDNFPDSYKVNLIHLTDKGWFIEVENTKVAFNENTFSYKLDGHDHKVDLAIVFIHGDPGENGKIQGFLEMINVPYINSGPLASSLSFDKWFCNQFLRGFGFHVADSIYLTSAVEAPSGDEIAKKLGLPVFVKPCDSGSSYGISRANQTNEIDEAVQFAFNEGETVIVEGFLDGTEVTCGVYRSENGVETLPLTEIVTENEFFDFEAKYEGLSEEITPARISEGLTLEVQRISAEVYKLLRCRSIVRIDFMLVNDVPFIIEVNTIPGFSPESIVPKMIHESGKTIGEVWQEILTSEDL